MMGGEVIGGIVWWLCGSKLGVFDEGVEWGFFVDGQPHRAARTRGLVAVEVKWKKGS